MAAGTCSISAGNLKVIKAFSNIGAAGSQVSVSNRADETNALSLFIFIDALGWEVVAKHRFLAGWLTRRSPLQTVFGYSSACDPSILTGLNPDQHGHLAFFTYNPPASPFTGWKFLSLLPRAFTRRGRVRRWISILVQKVLGYTGYFQLYNIPFDLIHNFDYTEKKDLYQKGGINSGALTVFDHLRSHGVDFHLTDWRKGDEAAFADVAAELALGKVSLAYLFLGRLDAVLHEYGTESPKVEEELRHLEDEIRSVLDVALANYGEVRLFVFSDHGMADVAGICDLAAVVDATGLQFGKDYGVVYDSTMARFWFHTQRARRKITVALKAVTQGRILSQAELQRYGADFPDHEYGELFFLLDTGILLCPSFMGCSPLKGMHGYDPDDCDSVAFFGTNVESGPAPKKLTDMFGLMMRESGIVL